MKRTPQQNRSLHLFCEQLAEVLNDADLEIRHLLESAVIMALRDLIKKWEADGVSKILIAELESVIHSSSERVDIPWSKPTVKELIWRPVQEATTGKKSTTELDTIDPSPIYEVLARHFAQKHGIQIPPWPSEETR